MPRGPKNELHSAAQCGSAAATTGLLCKGSIDIDQGCPKGYSPLMYATGCGHTRIVRILLNKGASTSVVSDGGYTALLAAAEFGYLAICKLLVKAGAPLDASSVPRGITALHMAAKGGHLEVMHVLIEAGANPNSRGSGGWTPMYVAAQEGSVSSIKMLLRANADPLLITTDSSDFQIPSVPLDAAARCGHPEVVRELIRQRGVEGCGGTSGGVDALKTAAGQGHVDVVAVLTDAGVVDTGEALRMAARYGREAPVKFLLQQYEGKPSCERACVNYRGAFGDIYGATPLLFAVGYENVRLPSTRILRLMVDAGADTTSGVRLTDAEGKLLLVGPLLDIPTVMIRDKLGADGKDATEDLLHRLEGIRRLLLRIEAVHAVSWLWQSDAPSVVRAAEGARTTETTSAPLSRMLPLLRRRARRRGVSLATLFRHSQKKF